MMKLNTENEIMKSLKLKIIEEIPMYFLQKLP